jgi:hypothetical protein
MKSTRCFGLSESYALLWPKQRVALENIESNTLPKALFLLAVLATRCFRKQRVVTIRNDFDGLP